MYKNDKGFEVYINIENKDKDLFINSIKDIILSATKKYGFITPEEAIKISQMPWEGNYYKKFALDNTKTMITIGDLVSIGYVVDENTLVLCFNPYPAQKGYSKRSKPYIKAVISALLKENQKLYIFDGENNKSIKAVEEYMESLNFTP